MPNVLIADDSIAVRKVAERLLTEAGLGVILVANGEEALAYLAKETPDLVVSDVIMPDKSGHEGGGLVRARARLAGADRARNEPDLRGLHPLDLRVLPERLAEAVGVEDFDVGHGLLLLRRAWSMIPKSGNRFSDKIMLNQHSWIWGGFT